MAKTEKKQEVQDEQNPPITFGQVDDALSQGAEEVDPFEAIPTVVPGKPGFDKVGAVLAGFFVRTKRVVSDKFTAGKVDPKTGETYRLLHILRDAKGVVFGIWSVGQLGAAMRGLDEGDYIEVIYNGLGEPLRKGQDAPHTFRFKGKNKDGGKLVFDWDKLDAEAAEHMPPQGMNAAGMTNTARQ